MPPVNMYTDGACSGNQSDSNFGGWGTVLEYGEHKKELYGGQVDTTNNRMELTAVIAGFEALKKEGMHVRVFTDSSYVANCFREGWYFGWIRNGWVNSAKKPVENRDLWERLISLIQGHKVEFFRVKGHVNLNSKSTDLNKLHKKFQEWNGESFDFQQFKYVTEMNNLADALAVKGAEEVKS